MNTFEPQFSITNRMTQAITRIERVLGYLLQHGKMTIQDFEALCPTVNRRSLQRDLKGMLDKNLIVEVGAEATDPTRPYLLAEL